MFPDDRLDEGEEVVTSRRSHWTALRGVALICIVAVVCAIAVLVYAPRLFPVVLVLLFVVALGTIGHILQWRSIHIVLTNRRLLSKDGFLVSQTFEVPLERVLHTEHHQTFVEKMFGVGRLMIETAGETGNRTYRDISDPAKFEKLIYHYIEVAENTEPGKMLSDGTGQSTLKAKSARVEQRRQSRQRSANPGEQKQRPAEKSQTKPDRKTGSPPPSPRRFARGKQRQRPNVSEQQNHAMQPPTSDNSKRQENKNASVQEKQDIADEIRILHDLKEDSVISESEYADKKSELLDKM